MLGSFGSLFRVTSSNTRMEIKRDESQAQNRKAKDSDGDSYQSIPWEDTTEVTVSALRAFLHTLLYGDEAQTAPIAQTPPPSTRAGRAASAYQSTARAVHDPNVTAKAPPPVTPQPVDMAEGDRPILDESFGEDERLLIQTYLQDLSRLQGLGVEVLTIQRNLTFLEAIGESITRHDPARA
jgi:hypothetical protein